MKAKKFYRPYVKPVRQLLRRLKGTSKEGPVAAGDDLQYRPARLLTGAAAITAGTSEDDNTIIDRVLRAYRKGGGDLAKPSAMWAHIYNQQQAPLHDILISSDRPAVEKLLRRPGDSSLFYGFDGTIAEFVKTYKRDIPPENNGAVSYQDFLVRTAELIGALRMENFEHRVMSHGVMPADKILEKINDVLGVKLNFPNPFPDELGLSTKAGIASYRAIHAIYQTWRIRELVKHIPAPRILEIGAGLGRNAYYAWLMGMKDYTIIDLPFTGVSQGYFLMRTLGEKNVILEGEELAADKVKILQPSSFLESSNRYDLIVNVDSLTEIGRPAAEQYWDKIQEVSSQFLSINHEVNKFTVREIALARGAKGMRSQRYGYDLRKGYAEELFTFPRKEM